MRENRWDEARAAGSLSSRPLGGMGFAVDQFVGYP
jgi:hypothetical protein